ncbi:cytochrome P450 [Rhodococcus gannanensis]|uniref:Cytochrome P450 n=1 Tax=Rhodococcus gannanensis TaxID=1960308 RepID=A0ABW4P609_9NOCA
MSAEKCPHAAVSSPDTGATTGVAILSGRGEPVPTPRFRLPLLGDLLSVDPAKPVQKEMRMAADLGPIFERKIVSTRLVVVSGVDLVAEVNDEAAWAKSLGAPIRKLRSVAADGLFTAYNSEPNWAKAQRILNPGFSQAALRNYHGSMLRMLEQMTGSWDAAAEEGARVDVAADTTRLALDVIGSAGFGHDFGSFARAAGDDPFVDAMSRVLAHVNRTSNDMPLLRTVLGRKADAQHRADIALMHRVVDDVIAQRRQDPDVEHRDLLDLMLHSTDPETGELLDPVNVRNQVVTFLIAGNETTAGTLAFALYFLARHPEVAAAARAEIDGVVPGDGPIAFEQVGKLRYLRRVVDETLRLWPAAPGYFRKVRHDTTLGGRYRMPKGSWVFVLLPQLHRDPVWGPDPDRFDPDRFLPEAVRARPAHAYRPFGTGPRSCIGRQFALHEAVLALAVLLRRYELEPDPGYELDVREAITLKPQGFELRLRRRG